MNRNAKLLIAYGGFLILIGVLGYLSNPEKAKTALMSGGTFGLINIGLGLLAAKGWSYARVTAIVVACFLWAVFTWRASVGWIAVAGGEGDKLVAAVLISAMWVATTAVIVLLCGARARESTSPGE